ncbi:MAG: PKD domain-containing protein [Candidatus Eremiobacteraeota bacterium]|nr:PKD domain-containing protein [Candidatus Eremiobacteraeota bacterium]
MKLDKSLLTLFLVFLAALPVYSFSTFRPLGGTVHESITRAAVGSYFTQETFGFIDTGNTDQDRVPHYLMAPTHHFDDNSIDGSLDYADTQYVNAISAAGSADESITGRNKALEYLGHLFHTVQDFYAHSNYVELCLKKGIKPENIKPLYLFGTQLNSPPAGLKTGYFYFSNVYSNEKLRPRKVCIDGLRAEHPRLKFADDAEYKLLNNSYKGAIDYMTGDYTLIHEDVNKDDESTREGALKVPGSNYTLYAIARKVAIEETRAQWNRFIEEIKKEYPGKATAIINALTGKAKPKPAASPVPTPVPTGGSTQIEGEKHLSVALSAAKTTIKPGEKVTVKANVTGGKPRYEYAWILDNNPPNTKLNSMDQIDITVGGPGRHTLLVIVKDASNPRLEARDTVAFTTPAPETKPLAVSLSAARTTARPGEKVTVKAGVSGGKPPYEYAWTFSGVPSTGCNVPSVDITLPGPGKHTLVVIVKDASSPRLEANGAVTITAVAPAARPETVPETRPETRPLSVTLSASKTTVKPGEKVAFTAKAQGGVKDYSYSWFLDGRLATGAQHSLTNNKAVFKNPGDHTVKVHVQDEADSVQEASVVIRVKAAVPAPPVEKPLKVTLSAGKARAQVGETIQLYAKATGGSQKYTYRWSVNGKTYQGAKHELPSNKAKFKNPGKYTVAVYVTDARDSAITAEDAVAIDVIEAPQPPRRTPAPPPAQNPDSVWSPFAGQWTGYSKVVRSSNKSDIGQKFKATLSIVPYKDTYAIYIGSDRFGSPEGYKVSGSGNTLTVAYKGPVTDTTGRTHKEVYCDATLKLTVNKDSLTGGQWMTITDDSTTFNMVLSLSFARSK